MEFRWKNTSKTDSDRVESFQELQLKPHAIWNNLFLKVYINHAIMVILVAVMLGTIFIRLYQDNSTEDYRKQLIQRADAIAGRFNEFILNKDYEGCLSYMLILRELAGEEVWSIPNPNAKNPMHSSISSMEVTDSMLQKDAYEVTMAAFNGKRQSIIYFSDIHDSTMLMVGVPVNGIDREVCGALLLFTPLSNMDEMVYNSQSLIVISTIVALLVSFIIAIVFARKLSRPIQKMSRTALELAEGKYETKTGITRGDEIGDLARTLDFLTVKLQENDIERKNLEQMRMDFFANVSHELRTPIAVIRAYSESLIDGVVTEETKVQQYHNRMLSECKSMERLVGDLLTLSKMQNPDFEVEMEPVNLVQVFDEIIRGVKVISKEKGVSIQLEKELDIYMMMGDYDRLRQMFLVIFDNAVKFSQDGSTIRVLLSQDEKLIVSIADEGIGIAKEELPNIFDRFYKSKLRQNAKGTGLGLAIAKQIAIKHNGQIEVESEVGHGTTFRFTFNFVTEEEFIGTSAGKN